MSQLVINWFYKNSKRQYRPNQYLTNNKFKKWNKIDSMTDYNRIQIFIISLLSCLQITPAALLLIKFNTEKRVASNILNVK